MSPARTTREHGLGCHPAAYEQPALLIDTSEGHPQTGFMTNRKIQLDPVHQALETLPYGLYIIGSRGADNINGMMADWVMPVSFNPRLVALSLEHNSTTLRNLRQTGFFTINVPSAGDQALAARFCQPRD